MLFSKASGRKVVSTSTADTVGKVDEFVVDPQSRHIVALVLKKTDDAEILQWSAITAFGDDAVTVKDVDALTEGDEKVNALSGKDHRVRGKRVLTTAGDELGEVEDVEFDATSGEVIGLHLKKEQIEGTRLVGVGSYAVVVEAK